MKYKLNAMLKILKNEFGHEFNIGERVEVVDTRPEYEDYEVNIGELVEVAKDMKESDQIPNCDKCNQPMVCIDHCPDYGDEWECEPCKHKQAYKDRIKLFEISTFVIWKDN